jgi:TonB family protein
MMEMRVELSGFSTDALPDKAVQVPADYKAASIGDFIKAQVATVPKVAPSAPVVSAQAPLPPGLSRSVPISSRPPVYTEEARLAKIEGRVSLSIVVDASGNPQNIQVVQSLDPGLDQKAIEAVQEWKFQPGLKDGNPVAVLATIQVNFQLLDKPPAKQQ